MLPAQTEQMIGARADRMMELALIKQEYWGAWHKSQKDREVQTQEKIINRGRGNGNGEGENDNGGEENRNSERIKAGMRTEGQCGDTRFLDGVRKVIQEECKIAGFYAPKKLEHSGDDKKIPEIQFIEVIRPGPRPPESPVEKIPEPDEGPPPPPSLAPAPLPPSEEGLIVDQRASPQARRTTIF
jgi:hypothetical protein